MKTLWLILAVFSLSSVLAPSLAWSDAARAHVDACAHETGGAADCCGGADMSAAACAQLCNAMVAAAPIVVGAGPARALPAPAAAPVPEAVTTRPPAPPPRAFAG